MEQTPKKTKRRVRKPPTPVQKQERNHRLQKKRDEETEEDKLARRQSRNSTDRNRRANRTPEQAQDENFKRRIIRRSMSSKEHELYNGAVVAPTISGITKYLEGFGASPGAVVAVKRLDRTFVEGIVEVETDTHTFVTIGKTIHKFPRDCIYPMPPESKAESGAESSGHMM